MKLYFVVAESTDWCGISEEYVVTTRDDQNEETIENHLGFIEEVESAIRDYLDEDDIDENEGVHFSLTVEEFNSEDHGDPESLAYHKFDISNS